MTEFPASVTSALDPSKLARTGAKVSYDGRELLPANLTPDAIDILPAKARGDYREKTVNLLIRDASDVTNSMKETDLIGGSVEDFARHPDVATDLQPVLSQALEDHFVVHTARNSRFLFPFHTLLPSQFKFAGREKMYTGRILSFFATPGDAAAGDAINSELLERFYALFNGEDGLSLLDHQLLRLARTVSRTNDATASAEQLIDRYPPTPVFFAESHRLIQRDLDRVLSLTALGRRDQVTALLTILYLHIAVHYWRAAWCLDDQVRAFVAFLEQPTAVNRQALARSCEVRPVASGFRGALKFRVASSRERRISKSDGAAQAYDEVDRTRLLRLPLNLALLGIARDLTQLAPPADFGAIADALAELGARTEFDALCRAIAWAQSIEVPNEMRGDLQRRIESEPTGFGALLHTIQKLNRRELRRRGRDITAQVMKRGGKGLVAVRGNIPFFELGQELLVLLTKLLAGDEHISYRTFLERLSDYGLVPQDRDESEELINVMRSMQLLERHSDAGEALYVSHFL